MAGRSLGIGLTLLVLSGCGVRPVLPASFGAPAATQAQASRAAAWTIAAVDTAPEAVLATLDQEKAEVIQEIQKAEHLKSVSLSPERSIREWRIGGRSAGYVLTLHGNVVFDVPTMKKAGAFIVDFCIDPSGNDFGGVYAFTVNSERPATKLRPAHGFHEGANALALVKVAAKPVDVQAACTARYGPQRDLIAAQYPGLRVAALTAFPSAIAVQYEGAVVGYIDAQTASALPSGDVLGIQVLNHVSPSGTFLYGEARAASANDPAGYRTIRL